MADRAVSRLPPDRLRSAAYLAPRSVPAKAERAWARRRTGTQWGSRYKSSAVPAETTILLCQRYVELNPVRAALVDHPAHYHWSSYRHNALRQAKALLTPHQLYLPLGGSDPEHRPVSRLQLDWAAIDDIRLALDQNQPLGNARFLDEIERMIGWRSEALPRGCPRTEVRDSGVPTAQEGEFGL
ncbi:MAG: hypothetical protein WBP72_07145 [Rhodocyclaceae bacterium]